MTLEHHSLFFHLLLELFFLGGRTTLWHWNCPANVAVLLSLTGIPAFYSLAGQAAQKAPVAPAASGAPSVFMATAVHAYR